MGGGNRDEPGHLRDGSPPHPRMSRLRPAEKTSHGDVLQGSELMVVFLYRNQSDYRRKEKKKRWKQGVLCKASVCMEHADVIGRDGQGHLESASLLCCVADHGIIQHRK